MGGEAPPRSDLIDDRTQGELLRESRRRAALVQLGVGVPAFSLVTFGVVLAYRLAGQSLGDLVFWAVLAPIVAVFAVYCGRAAMVLRRTGDRSRERSRTEP